MQQPIVARFEILVSVPDSGGDGLVVGRVLPGLHEGLPHHRGFETQPELLLGSGVDHAVYSRSDAVVSHLVSENAALRPGGASEDVVPGTGYQCLRDTGGNQCLAGGHEARPMGGSWRSPAWDVHYAEEVKP